MADGTVTEQAGIKWELASLVRIFYEPGAVFDGLAVRPRFILAWLVVILFATAVNYTLVNKVGFENIIRQRIESSSSTADLSSEQKEQIIESQSSPIVRIIAQVTAPIAIMLLFTLGGLYYWLGANAMGGRSSFVTGLSVWIYSSLAPTVLLSAANLIVLALKSADDLPIDALERGLVSASPALFLGDDASKPLLALLSSIDLFAVWGWTLAAIGLQRTARLSAGAAWGVVMLMALFGIAAKVVGALF